MDPNTEKKYPPTIAKKVYSTIRHPIYPLRFFPDDKQALNRVKASYKLKNMAITIRLCFRLILSMKPTVDEVIKINEKYEKDHPQCVRITIGKSPSA